MSPEPDRSQRGPTTEDVPRAQRLLDNLWLLLVLSVAIPALLYLGWGLWELVELPRWAGGS